jgi:hypothetical protein
MAKIDNFCIIHTEFCFILTGISITPLEKTPLLKKGGELIKLALGFANPPQSPFFKGGIFVRIFFSK